MFVIKRTKLFVFLSMVFLFHSGFVTAKEISNRIESTVKNNEDVAVLAVHQAIRDNQLTQLRDHCLAYDYDDVSDKDYFIVDVREDKRYAICGGDPNTSVHLFRFRVDRKDYSLMTDAGSDDGVFHSVKK